VRSTANCNISAPTEGAAKGKRLLIVCVSSSHRVPRLAFASRGDPDRHDYADRPPDTGEDPMARVRGALLVVCLLYQGTRAQRPRTAAGLVRVELARRCRRETVRCLDYATITRGE